MARAKKLTPGQEPLPTADVPAGTDGRSGMAATVDFGPLPTQIGYMLRLAQLAAFQDFIRTFSAVDIRPTQHAVLTIIDRNPGIKQGDIGLALNIKRTNVVPLLDSLEKRGLAKRKKAEGDRRSYALYLTDKGKNLMVILDRLREEHEQRLVSLIGPDARDTLIEVLGKMLRISDGQASGEDEG